MAAPFSGGRPSPRCGPRAAMIDERAMAMKKQLLKNYALVAAGSLVFALSFDWFFAPNRIAMGGITGLAQIINAVFPALPVGMLVIAINVPLFLVGWKIMGGYLLLSSLASLAVSSFAIDFLARVHAFQPMEPMLAALFGGALQGVGLGIVFSQNATTGGTDIVVRLLKLKLPWLPIGKLLLVPDVVILSLAGVVFGRIESTFYGLLALVVTSKTMDMVLYGLRPAKIAFIVTNRWRETKDALLSLNRGVTILHGRGGFSGNEKEILMIAFSQREIAKIKQIVQDNDPASFLIVCNAFEVLGEGFGEYSAGSL